MDIPSATNTALTWAFFMGTSANVRYQVLHSSALQGYDQSCAWTCALLREGQAETYIGACVKAVVWTAS